MEEVIFSLEDWDSIINFYRPNGSSKTWYLKELKKISVPLMWGEWVMFNEDNEMFSVDTLKIQIQPTELKRIAKYQTKELLSSTNSSHIYMINVQNPTFFEKNEEIGFSCMSEKYKDDVRNGKSVIVLLYQHEGYSGMYRNRDLEIVEKWRINENFSTKSIYYITGNLICNDIVKQKKLNFTCLPISVFNAWLTHYVNYNKPVIFNPIDDKNLYLSYNRQPRIHRIMLIYELIKNNLFDRGLISLNKPWNQPMKFIEDIEIQKFIFEKTPFSIDDSIDLKYNLACNIQIKDYERTFISLVTETLVTCDTLFLSEKIWKPIIVGHPFIVYGNKHTLKYLKELGYRTFDKWIDESYDNESDDVVRCKMIVDEIKKLSELSIDEMKKMRSEMYDVCYYNKNHFNMLFHQNWKDGINMQLEKYFLDIWDKLKNNYFILEKESSIIDDTLIVEEIIQEEIIQEEIIQEEVIQEKEEVVIFVENQPTKNKKLI